MTLLFTSPAQGLGIEEADPLAIDPTGIATPAVSPSNEPFEVTSLSPENVPIEEEILVLADLKTELAEIDEGITYNTGSVESLMKAVASLEELVTLIIDKVDVNDGALEESEIEHLTDRIKEIQGETPDLPPMNLIPSVEAFAAFPRPALESAAESLSHALDTAWEAIKRAYAKLVEWLGRFYAWIKKILGFNEKRTAAVHAAVKEVQTVAHSPDYRSSIQQIIDNEQYTLSQEHVRHLWVVPTNGISKDVPSDVRRLANAFAHTQETIDKMTIEWGTDMIHELKVIIENILHRGPAVKSRKEIESIISEWDKVNKSRIADKVGAANRIIHLYKGNYISGIELTGEVDTVSHITHVKVPNAITQKILSPEDIRHWQEARDELMASVKANHDNFALNKSRMDAVVQQVGYMIHHDLSKSFAGIAFKSRLESALESYLRKFKKQHEGGSAATAKMARLVAVIDDVILKTAKIYEAAEAKAGKDHDKK